MTMRLTQLRRFGIFYLVLNLLIISIAVITTVVYPKSDHIFSCLNECAIPNTNMGAGIMFISRFLKNVAIMALLYFFWFVPRKFINTNKRSNSTDVRLLSPKVRYDF